MPTANEATSRFADEVRSLLAALASARQADVAAKLRSVAASLARVYAAGLALPAEPPPERQPGGMARYPPLRLDLGTARAYQRHTDPDRAGSEELGDLEEDFEDLYAELTRGLAWFDSGTEAGLQAAAWHWRQSLNHWGHHLVEALRILHYRLFGLPGGR